MAFNDMTDKDLKFFRRALRFYRGGLKEALDAETEDDPRVVELMQKDWERSLKLDLEMGRELRDRKGITPPKIMYVTEDKEGLPNN